MIREHFLDVIDGVYFTMTSYKRTDSRAVGRASDLAAIVTSLQPGEVLVYEV